MNTLYVVLSIVLAAVSLLTVAYRIGVWQARTEDHLKQQDDDLAALRDQVGELHDLHLGQREGSAT